MKKSRIILSIFFVLSVAIQIVYFNNSDIFYQYGFAVGIDKSVKQLDIGINLIYVLLPIVFIVFLLSGSVEKMISGYGKLLIIRNYSKTRLFAKNCIKNNLIVLIVVLFQTFSYAIVKKTFKSSESNVFNSILMYFLFLSAIMAIQCFLEFFTLPHIANIIIFIYCFVSCFIVQISPDNVLVKLLLFPCLLFGMQNGAAYGNNVFYFYLVFSVLVNCAFTLLGLYKFKKADIF